MRQPQFASLRRQQGAMLIIALVMLVLITLISISTVRTTTMQERMAGNSRDRDKAFQAAEAAVQSCLTAISAGTYAGTPLTPTSSPTAQRWEGTWDNSNSTEVTVDTAGLAAQPRCMYETLGSGGSYRVTGRAVGSSTLTVVILQATYSVE